MRLKKDRRIYYLTLVIGLILRIAWALCVDVIPVSDSNIYNEFAHSIVNGNGYSYLESGRLTAYWPVGTSAFYALIYKIFGYTYVPIVILNIIMGTYLISAVYRLTKKHISKEVANVASLIIALWPLLIQYTTILASELLFLSLIFLSFDIWYSKKLGFLGNTILWSITLCCAVYVRTVALPLFFVVPFSEYIMKTHIKKALAVHILSFVIGIAVFSPWVVRNYRLFDNFVLISTNSGANLWMGNNPESQGAYMEIPKDKYKSLNEYERDEILKSEAVEFILSDPIHYVKLCFRRLIISYKAETIGIVWNEVSLKANNSENSIFFMKLFSSLYWLFFFCLSIVGILFFWLKSYKNIFSVISLSYLYFFIIPILIVGQDRYHIPIDPFVAMFASFFLVNYIPYKNILNIFRTKVLF